MANRSTSGFGFKAAMRVGNTPSIQGQSKYDIKDNTGVGLFKGNPVALEDGSGDQGFLQDMSFDTTDDGGNGGLHFHPKVWVPPSSLDAPPAPDGFRYRWIRAEVVGYQDTKNITGRLREGYELVRAEEVENASDYPVLDEGKYKGVIGVGGLLLAKVPVEIAKQRQDYMTKRHEDRNEAVGNDICRAPAKK